MVDLVLIHGHLNHMKVKIGELKTHLSKYLRQLERDEERIEVCVREDTVAYLTSAKAEPANDTEKRQIAQHLESVGIEVSQWGANRISVPAKGGTCKHPAEGANSVESIRQERNW